jgi:signal transduction histidine kinase
MPEVVPDDDRRQRSLETIDRETRRLERIVKDLLDLARYERGAVVLHRRLFDIERLLENVAGRHERHAQTKGVAIRFHVEAKADQLRDLLVDVRLVERRAFDLPQLLQVLVAARLQAP